MTRPERPRLPCSVVVALALVGALGLSAAHLVNAVTLHQRLLDADLENNLPTWFSSAVFLLAALAALSAGAARRGHLVRSGWVFVALFTAAASVDEVASLHEEAGRRLGAETTLSLTQPVAAALVAVALLVLAGAERGRARTHLGQAVTLLLVSQACASVAGLLASGGTLFLLEAAEDLTEALTAVALLAAGTTAAGFPVTLRPAALRRELIDWWAPERLHEPLHLASSGHR